VDVQRRAGSHLLAESRFAAPMSLVGSRTLYVYFRGEGTQSKYRFDARSGHGNEATFNFIDTASGWRVLEFPLQSPDSVRGAISWGAIRQIRISARGELPQGG